MSERCAAGREIRTMRSPFDGNMDRLHADDETICTHPDSPTRDSQDVICERDGDQISIRGPRSSIERMIAVLQDTAGIPRDSHPVGGEEDVVLEGILASWLADSAERDAALVVQSRIRSLRSSLATVSRERDDAHRALAVAEKDRVSANERLAAALKRMDEVIKERGEWIAKAQGALARAESAEQVAAHWRDRAPRPEETGETS